jgi:hypothetical protein
VGLSASDGTTPIQSSATVAGRRVTLVQGTADAVRTVLFIDVPPGQLIPPHGLTVKDQFGHVYGPGFDEASADANLTDRSLSVGLGPGATAVGSIVPAIPSGTRGQLALVLPPVSGPAAVVGARLTLQIDQLASSGSGSQPFVGYVRGPWTLTASLVVQSAHSLPVPPSQTIDGTTSSLTSVREAGGILDVRASVSGGNADRPLNAMPGLRRASGRPVQLIYGEFVFSKRSHHLDLDYTFRRPAPGTYRLTIGQATFKVEVP